MGEYHELFVQLDTLLLTDVFENFRESCQRIYQLHPAHFLSAPALAWQECLKIKLELLTDLDMLLMVEQGIRGGICQAIHHYETANNKYMKNYNKDVISTFLQYLDANSLYGWPMCKKLPIGEFKWAKKLSIYRLEAIKMYDENNDYGALLEGNTEYPTMKRIKHKDLPFLPQRKKINKADKLVTTLEEKEKYVIHISALKQALNHGWKLKKLHRVIRFKQEAWLKPCIDMNIKLRTQAKNDFETDLFKLMNNWVFGKTMQNVRNHRDIKLVTTNGKRRKYISEPNYMSSKCFSEDLIVIEMRKTKITVNKSVYLLQAILDISETLTHKFFYDHLKLKYRDKVKLCYMVPDSFNIHIQTDDLYIDIAQDVDECFHTSGYDEHLNRPLQIGIKKKSLACLKMN